ncbi:uncharacterized protein LOC135836450 [Planococcus citri]|uniref:uncharacterized protein LOC135836450 n=1 Tax=Planococcus citri TaxID=170843 RepID=UPI0031F9490E
MHFKSIFSWFNLIISIYVALDTSEGGHVSLRVISSAQPDKMAVLGNDETIDCAIDGWSGYGTKWVKDGIEVTSDAFTILDNGNLMIKNVEFSDAGNYTCYATNKTSSKNTTTTVRVVLSEPVTYLYASLLDDTTMHLYFEKPRKTYRDVLGYNISFQVVHNCDLGPLQSRIIQISENSDADELLIQLRNLKPNTKYKFYVSAITCAGQGEIASVECLLNKKYMYMCDKSIPLHTHKFGIDGYPFNDLMNTGPNCTNSTNGQNLVSCDYWSVVTYHSWWPNRVVPKNLLGRQCSNETTEFNSSVIIIPALNPSIPYVSRDQKEEKRQSFMQDLYDLLKGLLESVYYGIGAFFSHLYTCPVLAVFGIVLVIRLLRGKSETQNASSHVRQVQRVSAKNTRPVNVEK